MRTCLVWAERSTPDSFWVPSHWFNSATGEHKGITQNIYTDSEPPSRLPNSIMPSAKLRIANLPVFMFLVWRGTPGPRADPLTTMLCGGGLYRVCRVLFMSDSLSSVWGPSVHFGKFAMLKLSEGYCSQNNFNTLYGKYGNQGGIQPVTFWQFFMMV